MTNYSTLQPSTWTETVAVTSTPNTKAYRKQSVEVSYDNVEDLKVLEYWNKIRFGNTSSFNERPHWDEFFSETATKYPSKIITVTAERRKNKVWFCTIL